MKRLLAAALLLCVLSGCSLRNNKEVVTFYYPQKEFSYGTQYGSIGSEVRDIAGHQDDLQYLFSLFLMGPSDDKLDFPFPLRARLLDCQKEDDRLVITLSEMPGISDSRFALGCCCIAQIWSQLHNDESPAAVTVISGAREITLSAGDVVMNDYGFSQEAGEQGGSK